MTKVSTNIVQIAKLIVKYAKNENVAMDMMRVHGPDDEVKTFEEFEEVGSLFGFGHQCAAEMWGAIKDGTLGTLVNGEHVGMTYRTVMATMIMALEVGTCKDCTHRPGGDEDEDEWEVVGGATTSVKYSTN